MPMQSAWTLQYGTIHSKTELNQMTWNKNYYDLRSYIYNTDNSRDLENSAQLLN
jgi:hypothetical protein